MHALSSIFRHRNARASAFTMALSTRGRGAHSAPSGVTTSFRPPRFRNIICVWMTMVSPVCRNYRLLFIPLPSCARRLTHQSGESIRARPDVDAVRPQTQS